MINSFLTWALGIAIVVLTSLETGSLAGGSDQPWYAGVNLAGAEFNERKLPGKIHQDYLYPSKADLDYFLDGGFKTIRFPFRWERLQAELGEDFSETEIANIDNVVKYTTDKGGYLILDPHNYGKYRNKEIGTRDVPVSAFVDLWTRLADRYKDNPRVIFGLMNEPHSIRADQWRPMVDRAMAGIRETGARNLILVPGTYWSGAHSWSSNRRGQSNARAFETLRDSASNFAFEVHQYFDNDYSGTSDNCQSAEIGVKSLEKFTAWLREHKHRGFLGEFGAANIPLCLEALDRMMQHIKANSDVWIGWTYWAAGAWWGDYRFSVHPSADGKMKPQLEVLKKYTGAP